MSTTRPTALRGASTSQPRRLFGPVADLLNGALEMFERHERRKALRELDDRQLHDVGITRFQVQQEIRKPFWKA